MSAGQRRPFRVRWVSAVARALTVMACGGWALTAPAWGQVPPAPPATPQVETYYGLQRLQPSREADDLSAAAPAAPVVAPVLLPQPPGPLGLTPLPDLSPALRPVAHSQPAEP